MKPPPPNDRTRQLLATFTESRALQGSAIRLPEPLVDSWLADEWCRRNANRFLYDLTKGQWLRFDGVRWNPQHGLTKADTAVVESVADWNERVCAAYDEARLKAHAAACEAEQNPAKRKTMEDAPPPPERKLRSLGARRDVLANVRQRELVTVEAARVMDTDPDMLGTPAGIVDLRTGELRPGTPSDLIMRSTSVTPAKVPTPLWSAFLSQTFGNDHELIGYVQRLAGYCLTGHNREQKLWLMHGPGGNGKGVFLSTLQAAIGVTDTTGYSATSNDTQWTERKYEPHAQELAVLAGARLVVTNELPDGARLNEQRIKAWSGADLQKANFMRENSFHFVPVGKLVFPCNNLPLVRRVDAAWVRRVRVVPFSYAPPTVDDQLGGKLKAELTGILQWMMDGAREWYAHGIGSCEVVKQASAVYVASLDYFGEWYADSYQALAGHRVKVTDLTDAFNDAGRVEYGPEWQSWTVRKMAAELVRRGVKVERAGSGSDKQNYAIGIAVRKRNDANAPF